MKLSTPTTSLYLKPGRLADVLALIQILAFQKFAKRSDDGIVTQLRRKPITADTWIEIGKQHPEFFRVLEAEYHTTGKETVALIARFVQEPLPKENDNDLALSPPLSSEQTSNLFDLAIQLHDREVQRRDKWKTLTIPIVVAIIAAGASITGAIIITNGKSNSSQPVNIQITKDIIKDGNDSTRGISNEQNIETKKPNKSNSADR